MPSCELSRPAGRLAAAAAAAAAADICSDSIPAAYRYSICANADDGTQFAPLPLHQPQASRSLFAAAAADDCVSFFGGCGKEFPSPFHYLKKIGARKPTILSPPRRKQNK